MSGNSSQLKHQQAWALFQNGQLAEARKLYRQICRRTPGDDRAWAMDGIIQGRLGDYAGAEQSTRRALSINPGNFDAYVNHGHALIGTGQADRALESYQEASRLQPDNPAVLFGMGNAYANLDLMSSAETCYRGTLKKQPENIYALGNLANVLAYQGKTSDAIATYRKALMLNPLQSGLHSNLLLCLHYTTQHDPETIHAEHLAWAKQHISNIPARSTWRNPHDPDKRLRIGYVTADLRVHSVAYFIEPLLRGHDRDEFEIYCYANSLRQDSVTQRLLGHVDRTHIIAGLPNPAVANIIADDMIDILVDLGGHTENNRLLLFAGKPAPVQMTYLGYPNTTGVPAMDYRITDSWADPPGMTEHLHTEKLARVEHGFLCFSPPSEAPEITPPPMDVNDHITFGSFNVATKIMPEIIDAWTDILKAVENSRILIKNKQLTDPEMIQRLLRHFKRHGIHETRVTLKGKTSKQEHMASYAQVDIALDTFPYSGTTTTCDTLWMGIPVITLAGNTHVSRVSASLLARIALQELVAGSYNEYISLAVSLAENPTRIRALRASLRERMRQSTICDEVPFCRDLESVYRNAWRAWCNSRAT